MVEIAKDETRNLPHLRAHQEGGANEGNAGGGRGQHTNAPSARGVDVNNMHNASTIGDGPVAYTALLGRRKLEGDGTGRAPPDSTRHEGACRGATHKANSKVRQASLAPNLGLLAASGFLHSKNPGIRQGSRGHGRMLDSSDIGRPNGEGGPQNQARDWRPCLPWQRQDRPATRAGAIGGRP